MKKMFLCVFILAMMDMGLSAQSAISNRDGKNGPGSPLSGTPPSWVPAPNLLYNMQIIGKLKYTNGEFSLNPNDMVGAFSGNECRGVMSPNPGVFGIIFLTAGANSPSGETITFKAYLSAENIIVDLDETLVFLDQMQTGSIANPFIFSYHPPIPDTLRIQNAVVGINESRCYEAGHTIITAGNGTYFIVESGATASLGAGVNTILLPGTHFQHGSIVHVVTDATGDFCGNLIEKSVRDRQDISEKLVEKQDIPGFCVIFPNPSSGMFTIELPDATESSLIDVAVYSSLGKKILKQEVSIFKQSNFDISVLPGGIYTISIINCGRICSEKVIKH